MGKEVTPDLFSDLHMHPMVHTCTRHPHLCCPMVFACLTFENHHYKLDVAAHLGSQSWGGGTLMVYIVQPCLFIYVYECFANYTYVCT